jgi:hypothetical protein
MYSYSRLKTSVAAVPVRDWLLGLSLFLGMGLLVLRLHQDYFHSEGSRLVRTSSYVDPPQPPRKMMFAATPTSHPCEKAAVNLEQMGCAGLGAFIPFCRRNEQRAETDEHADCLAAAKTPAEATACSPHFTCVVR